MTNPIRRGAAASLLDRGEAEAGRPSRRVEVTDKATSELHHVVGIGMFGRQSECKRRDLPVGARPAGVRARIVPLWRQPREVRLAKPGRGKAG